MAYIGNRVVAGVGSAVKVDLDAPTNALRVKNDGKIGIGKTDPTVELDVAGTVKATAFQGDGSALTGIESLPAAIDVNGSAPDDSLAIDSSGNVGIGTTAPTTSLEINAANTLGATFTGTTAGEGVEVSQTSYTADNYVSLIEGKYLASQAAPHVRIGAQYTGGGSKLVFGTSNSYGSGITNSALTIDPSGAVGIGTTSPASLLHLSSGSPRITLTDTGTGADHRINADSGAGNLAFDVDYNSDTASPSAVFNIKGSEKLRINTDGDVLPGANGTQDFGSTSLRWANIYTSDLHLNNGIGNYTIVEGEEDLFLYNNKNGKTYKFVLAEVDPSEAPKKMEK